ncbi:MAG TPA: ATP synthase F1 subunit delta [Longimicrobiales bacterium]|nr:ATP synthase F1 subunit delta [Longimicrobiales bacterium]
MRDTTVARSYAEALFELGERHDAHDDFAQGLNTITSLLESDDRVRAFLETPKIEVGQKKSALREALGEHVSPMFLHFVLVVLEKRRQQLIRAIAAEYRELLDVKLGRLHVQVTLAHEPDEAAEQSLTAELSRILGRSVIPHISVDPALLGGIVVRYGDRVMDGSLRRRLISLRHRMVEAALPLGA